MTLNLQRERIFIVISLIRVLIKNILRSKAVKETEIYEKDIALKKINDIDIKKRLLS